MMRIKRISNQVIIFICILLLWTSLVPAGTGMFAMSVQAAQTDAGTAAQTDAGTTVPTDDGTTAPTDDGTTAPIKVGVCELENFFQYDEDGNLYGYGADLLNAISADSGVQFEYVKVDVWEDLTGMLRDGRIDLMLPVSDTIMATSQFNYSDESIISSYRAVMTLDSRTDLYYEDVENLSQIRIAAIESTAENSRTVMYFKNRGITPNYVYYDTYEACRDALDTGEVDAVLSNIMDFTEGMKVLLRFNPESNYIVMRQDDSRIQQINYALADISLNNPTYMSSLERSWFSAQSIVPYTKDESLYMEAHPVLKIGIQADRKPLAFYDEDAEALSGMEIEAVKVLLEKTNMVAEFVAASSGDELEQMLAAGKVDAIMTDSVSDDTLFVSDTIVGSMAALAVRSGRTIDYDATATIALPQYYQHLAENVAMAYPDVQLLYCEDIAACAKAVKKNEADAIAADYYELAYLMLNPHYDYLAIDTNAYFEMSYKIVGKDNDTLAGIFNKSYRQISEEDASALDEMYTKLQVYDLTWMDKLYQYRLEMIAMTAILSIIIVAFVLYSRTRRQFYKEIQAKNRELENANHAKSQFLSSVSHDIRTPMNAIIGLTGLALEESEDTGAVRDYLENIQQSGKFLLGLVNDVLDMSKIESGKLELQPTHYTFKAFTTLIHNMVKPLCDEKHQTFIFDETEQFPDIMVDVVRFNQIFINLLSNAIKFTPEGGTVALIMERQPSPKNQLNILFTVKDSGIGMTEAFKTQLFTPFAREYHKDDTGMQGTGLGLSIVKSVIDNMGGTIHVESESGKGSTFFVSLSLIMASEMDSNADGVNVGGINVGDMNVEGMNVEGIGIEGINVGETHQADDNILADLSLLAGRHVLLVEDHPLNTVVAQKLLEKVDMIVDHAENGQCAVDMFAASEFGFYDAILMDIRMPVMDGLQAARTIRELYREDAKTVPIIAMTANAYDEDRKQSRDAGMNGHLTKPIEKDKLYGELINYMQNNNKNT